MRKKLATELRPVVYVTSPMSGFNDVRAGTVQDTAVVHFHCTGPTDGRIGWTGLYGCARLEAIGRVTQLYKNISMLFLFPVKDSKLSTGVNATFNASCYG